MTPESHPVDPAFTITFTDADSHGVIIPHNDPLVVPLQIADCEVARILIDTGSSVTVIFRETVNKMELRGYEMKPRYKPLTGFTGATTINIGTMKLPVHVGGVTKITKFLVVDKPTIYNAIMGTPWLYDMCAIASTYHQCLKSPAHGGIHTLHGSQLDSRTCFMAEHRLRKSPVSACLTVRAPTKSTPRRKTLPAR